MAEEKQTSIPEDVIYVAGRRYDKEQGRVVGKALAAYQLSAMEVLKKVGKLSIQARGKAISRACDVAAILERKGLAKISDVVIKTNTFEREGREIHVTEIEIKMNAT